MSTEHNSWHITEDEVEVPVRAADHTPKDISNMKPVSRKPAAIVGILLATAIGGVLTFDRNDVIGQVTGEQQTVRITNGGLEPQVITVSPGETISWVNEQDIPHYLVSEALCANGDQNCMSTQTAFQGQEISYTIPTTVPTGAYTYFSPTDTNIIGTISVAGGSTTPPPPAQQDGVCYSPSDCIAPEFCSSLRDGIVPGTCLTQEPVQNQPVETDAPTDTDTISTTSSPEPSPEPTSSNTEPTPVDDSEPVNPLLEAIRKQLESDATATGSPTSTSNGDAATPVSTIPGIAENPYTVSNPDAGPPPIVGGVQASTINTIAETPFRQPATGIGTWLAFVAGAFSLWFVLRKSRRYEVRQ